MFENEILHFIRKQQRESIMGFGSSLYIRHSHILTEGENGACAIFFSWIHVWGSLESSETTKKMVLENHKIVLDITFGEMDQELARCSFTTQLLVGVWMVLPAGGSSM